MCALSLVFSEALAVDAAAAGLADEVESELGSADAVVGALVLASAAAGSQGREVGAALAERWPGADLVGTSFEGLLAEGRVWRDQPALAVLAWSAGPQAPEALAFEGWQGDVDSIAHEILHAANRERLGPGDLVLLFPDAHASPPIEPILPALFEALGEPALVGAAACGVDGAQAAAWVGREACAGSMVGLVLPGPPGAEPGAPIVRCASASRSASPWLEITSCRGHWVDGLEDETPLVWIRRQLGLGRRDRAASVLDRLLVRHRSARGAEGAGTAGGDEEGFEERYAMGLDERRGALSLPLSLHCGDEIAFALPDAALAREALRVAVDGLAPSRWVFQIACRARDERLHGDADLESAVVAAHVPGRRVLGVVAPFQLGPDGAGAARMRVHSTLLAALRPT